MLPSVKTNLLATAVLCVASIALAESTATFHADGRVTVGQKTFASADQFYRSSEFKESGARCGSEPTPISTAAPTDCGFFGTVIDQSYLNGSVEIPVVFHVIQTSGGQGNLTDSMLQSQIDILNEDFNALPGTPGEDGVPSGITFRLASLDPMGNATTGINRVTSDAYFSDPGEAPNDMKQALAWDPTRYLNLYTNDASGFLGYATFPMENNGREDGVVLLWNAVGRNAVGGAPYNQGRTATHEVGHYLGLFHTFQSGCGNTAQPYTTGDLLADTPAEAQPEFSCNTVNSGCGAHNAPNWNFMDYSEDACMTGFTAEQVNRMRCAIFHNRPEFLASNATPNAEFTFQANGAAVTFTDASTDANGDALSRAWAFGDGGTSTDTNPVHTYTAEGTYVVTLTVTDTNGASDSVTKSVVIEIPNLPPVAAFSYVATDLDVQFTNNSQDPENASLTYAWDFGDGESSTSESPRHNFAEAGTYTVSLTVTDSEGATDTATQSIEVDQGGGGGGGEGDGGGCCGSGNGVSSVITGAITLLLMRRRRRSSAR